MFEKNENEYGTSRRNEPEYTNYYDAPGTPESSYVNLYSDPSKPPKKSGGKKFLKAVAAVAALAVVSVSSIELYKAFGKESTSRWTSEAESEAALDTSEDDSSEAEEPENSASVGKAQNSSASWINMAAPAGSLTIPEIVDKALPSVVGISSTFECEAPQANDFFGFGFGFYNYGGENQKQQLNGTGTGIVMSEDGYVITNAHCIYDNDSQYKAGKAVSVSVVMDDEDETEYEAQIVGYDLQSDLAVLKIEANGLTPAEFGDSDKLAVGELVVAIGNPLGFELFGTTTCGIVSALNREITIEDRKMTMIQTDATINNGNSGGPLLNGYGQVIGINSAKLSSSYGSTEATVEGLGFAIPITSAKDIINDLINNGYVTGRPQIGITGQDVTESDAQRFGLPQGVYVIAADESSAAYKAGIRQGDIITAVDGVEITTQDELTEEKNKHKAGDTITLTIYRAGESTDVQLVLQETQQEG